MVKSNLIPITSKERARELGQIGGKKRSKRKRESARLRELKKRKLSQNDLDWIHHQILDSTASAFDILMYLEVIKEHAFGDKGTIKEKVKVLRLIGIRCGMGVENNKIIYTFLYCVVQDRTIDSKFPHYSYICLQKVD